VYKRQLADWNTTDKLVKREFFGFFGDISETTLAGEKASAREFASEYRGITGYYGLVNPSSDDYTLSIVAYTSKDQTQVATQDAFGFASSEIPLSGLSVAQVEHRRPKIDFNPLSTFRLLVGEYSNLYNPFWQARLVGVDELDLAEILKQVKQQFPQGTL